MEVDLGILDMQEEVMRRIATGDFEVLFEDDDLDAVWAEFRRLKAGDCFAEGWYVTITANDGLDELEDYFRSGFRDIEDRCEGEWFIRQAYTLPLNPRGLGSPVGEWSLSRDYEFSEGHPATASKHYWAFARREKPFSDDRFWPIEAEHSARADTPEAALIALREALK